MLHLALMDYHPVFKCPFELSYSLTRRIMEFLGVVEQGGIMRIAYTKLLSTFQPRAKQDSTSSRTKPAADLGLKLIYEGPELRVE